MKLFTKDDIAVDSAIVPAGTDVTDWPESRLRPLRRAGLIRVADEPGDDAADAAPAKPAKSEPKSGSTSKPKAAPADDADNSGEADQGADDDVTLESLDLAKNVLKAFAAEGITTLGQAEAYFYEHGSFEPLKGIAGKTSSELAIQFGLQSPDTEDAE